MKKRNIATGAATAVLFAGVVAGAQAQSFNWASAYLAAQPGQTIVVPAGSYAGFALPYRADLANVCSIANPSGLITFDVPGDVTVNGELSIFGSCVRIKGRNLGGGNYSLKVKGQVHTITQSQSQHPDNVIVESMDTVTASVFSADHVLYRDMDVGPATVVQTGGTPQAPQCGIVEGPGDENKINGRGFFVPHDITYDGLKIHDQGARNPERGNCHFGGLFIVNVDGLTIKNTVFERNVVYHVQLQNFAGPAPRDMRFEGNSFGCPVEWQDRGDICDGQRAIQLSTPSSGVTAVITGNASANGVDGLFGCYTPCDSSGVSVSANDETPESPTPPPLPGGNPDPPPPVDSLPLSIVSQTATTVTLGWTPAGDRGYYFYVDARRVSNTANPSRSTVKFAKVPGAVFRVEAVNLGPFGQVASP